MDIYMRKREKRRISLVVAIVVALALVSLGLYLKTRVGYAVYTSDEAPFFEQIVDAFFGARQSPDSALPPEKEFLQKPLQEPEVPAAPGPGTDVPLIVDDMLIYRNNGLSRQNDPAQFGFSLPETSGVTDPANIAIVRNVGGTLVEVPSQMTTTDVLSRWGDVADTSKPIKWILVHTLLDVPATGSNGEYFVRYGPLVTRNAQPQNPITVTQNAGSIFVNTGPAIFEISQTDFKLFTNVWIDKDRDNVVEQNSDDLIATADPNNGLIASFIPDPANAPTQTTRYTSHIRAGDRVFIEPDSGPLHTMVTAEFKVYDGAGTPLNWFKGKIRFHFSSGHSDAKVEVILVNEGNYGTGNFGPEQHLYFRDVKVDQKLVVQPTTIFFEPNIGLAQLPIASGEMIQLEQKFRCYTGRHTYSGPGCSDRADDKFSLEITRDGTPTPLHVFGPQANFGGASQGFLSIKDAAGTTVTIGMEDFWKNFPTAIALGDRVSLRFWPAGAIGPATPADYYMPAQKYGDRAVLLEGGRMAKHEYLIDFNLGQSPTPAEEFNKILKFTNPPFIRPAPDYFFDVFKDSGLLGTFFVPLEVWGLGPTPVEPSMVADLQRAERMLCTAVDYRTLYGGRQCGEQAGGAIGFTDIDAYRNRGGFSGLDGLMYGWWNIGDLIWQSGFSSNHYDIPFILLLQAIRGGGPKAMDLGRESARHRTYYDEIWTDPNIAPPYSRVTSHRVRNEKGDYHGNTDRAKASHEWLSGMILHALLSGDKEAFVAANGALQAFLRAPTLRARTNGPVFQQPYARETGWRLTNFVALYDLWGKPEIMTEMQGLANSMIQAEERDRQGWFMEAPTQNAGIQFWIEGIGMQAIARYYFLAQRVNPPDPLLPRAKATVLRAADLYARQTADLFPAGECPALRAIGQIYNNPVIFDHEYPAGSGSYYPTSVDNFWVPPGFQYPPNPAFKCDADRSQTPFYFNLLSLAARMTDAANPQERAQRDRYVTYARKLFSARARYFGLGNFVSVRRDNPADFSKISFFVGGVAGSVPKEFGWTGINLPNYLYMEWWLAQQQAPQIPTPHISILSPAYIPFDQAATVTLMGTGLLLANPRTDVLIDTMPLDPRVTVTIVSPTELSLRVPPIVLPQGRHQISLRNQGAQPPTSNSVELVVVPSFLIPSLGTVTPPVVANTQPNLVQITGNNLIDPRQIGATIALLANGQLYPPNRYQVFPSAVDISIPLGESPGIYRFEAQFVDPVFGNIISNPVYMGIISQPSVTRIMPTAVFNNVDNIVVLTGSGFVVPDQRLPNLVPSILLVNLNNNWVPYPFVRYFTESELRFEVLAGTAQGIYQFAVQNTLDSQQFPTNLRSTIVQLNVREPLATPTIDGVIPSSIQRTAPATIIIIGTGIASNPATQVIVDGTPFTAGTIAIDEPRQTITVQIPANTLARGRHTVQLENTGAQPPRSDPPFPLDAENIMCGNNVVEPGEQCDPPGSVCLISPGPNACTSTCQCAPSIPSYLPQIDRITPDIIPATQSVVVRVFGLNFLDISRLPPLRAELIANSNVYPYPYFFASPFEIQVPIVVSQPPLLNPGYYSVQARRRDPQGLPVLSNTKPFTIIGVPRLDSISPQIIVNDVQRTVALRGANFVPVNPQHAAVFPTIPFVRAGQNPPGRYTTIFGQNSVNVRNTMEIELTVPQLITPGVYTFYAQNTVDNVNLPIELQSGTQNLVVVQAGCNNGVLEPGEECEVGIPCTRGTCNAACRCEVAPTPGPGPSGGGGGSGSGGGGSGSVGFVMILDLDTQKEHAVELIRGSTLFLKYNDREYSARVEQLTYVPQKLTLKLQPRYNLLTLESGHSSEVLLDADSITDVKIALTGVTRNVRAKVTFTRLTPFSPRYLGPKPTPRAARRPQLPEQPRLTEPALEEGTTIVEDTYKIQKARRFMTFSLLTKVLAGAIAILVILLVAYVLLRRRGSEPVT